MMQKFSVNYKTYSQDEDLSFEPYLFKNKMIWIWESNATQPPIWYAGRHEDGRLMTLEDRCRKFLTERKIDFQALDFTQRKIKEIIIGKQLRSTMRTPISSQF